MLRGEVDQWIIPKIIVQGYHHLGPRPAQPILRDPCGPHCIPQCTLRRTTIHQCILGDSDLPLLGRNGLPGPTFNITKAGHHIQNSY